MTSNFIYVINPSELFYYTTTGGGAIILIGNDLMSQKRKLYQLGMLTTTCIFQRIALLIGWAKDQAGRIGNILEMVSKKRQYEILLKSSLVAKTDFKVLIGRPCSRLAILGLNGT